MSSRCPPHLRICDLTGQLAGAGATKILAAFGAQVIRVEDPVQGGLWDILGASARMWMSVAGATSVAASNNHNIEKLGITLDLRTERGKALFRRTRLCIRRRDGEFRRGRPRPAGVLL
jgi:crotonobetainyl-CoA:carnitine CoA-transferase CaiB-like acyl-CoA transferase